MRTSLAKGTFLFFLTALIAGCGGGSEMEAEVKSNAPLEQEGRAHAMAIRPDPANAAAAGRFTPPFEMGVIAVHMALQPDGRVMYYGTRPNGEQSAYFEYAIWDPTLGTQPDSVMTIPNASGTDLFCSAQTLLPLTGGTLIVGGDQPGVSNLWNNNSNVFDFRTNSIQRGPDMKRSRWYSSVTTLMNGEIYVQGGAGGADHPEVRQVDGTFRLLNNVITRGMNSTYPRNWVAPDGRVFGIEGNGSMYYVDPAGTGSLSVQGQLPAANGGLTAPAAMYQPGLVLKLATTSTAATVVDIRKGAPVLRPTEAGSAVRFHGTAVILPNGQVMALGGSSVDNQLSTAHYTADTWNPVTGQWTIGARYANARLYHGTSLLLPDGRVLLAGGGAPGPLVNTNGEIYSPPYLFTANGQAAPRPSVTAAPTMVEPGQTFRVTTGGPGIQRVTLVRFGSVTHSWNSDQRFVDLPFVANAAGTELSVSLPSRATDTPPGFYMLFVIDDKGVPSVARTMRIDLPGEREAAPAPTMDEIADQTWTQGAVTLRPVARSPKGAALRYSASGLPPGLSIAPATGLVTGTPTMAGTYFVTLAADDGAWTGTRSFTWVIAPDPFALNPLAASGPVATGTTLTVTASAAGNGVTYSWDFGDGTAPTAWSTNRTATHRYSTPGFYAITVTARDGSGNLALTQTVMQRVHLPLTARAAVASSQLGWQKPATGNPRLWVVNPDTDTVSALDAVTGLRLLELGVGVQPTAIAAAADGRLWVTNHRSSSVSIIDPASLTVTRTVALPFASAPYGVVADPTSNTVYVALEATGQVLRFDGTTFNQTGTLAVGPHPRHLALTGDGTALYVSRFITPALPGESTRLVAPGTRGGEVLKVQTDTMTVERTLVLGHSDRADAENQGRGVPNYLGAAAISPDGTQAFVPSKQDNIARGTARDGRPLDFQNTVRAVSSRLVLANNAEDLAGRIDHDNASVASAVAFDPTGVAMFVALETSREVAVINAHSRQEIMRFDAGMAPQALLVSPDGSALYVHNLMDRTVIAYDLRPLLVNGQLSIPRRAVMATILNEKLSPTVLRGKQLFYDARDTRLARDRYMSCASCHNDGGHDGRTWDFTASGEGLRNTVSLRGRGGMAHGALHWSGNFDEVQDFEGQIRALAGGTGLMTNAQFNTGTRAQPLGDAKRGVSADLDALAAYVDSLKAAEPSPWRNADGSMTADAEAGKAIFAASCVQCHGGDRFTDSRVGSRHDIGTLNAASGQRLGAPLDGLDAPTLRDASATAPYLHDGSAATLLDAIARHTKVPTAMALTAAQRGQVAAYVSQLGGLGAAPTWAASAQTVGLTVAARWQDNGGVQLTPALPGQFGMAWAREGWSTTQPFTTRLNVSLSSSGPLADGITLVFSPWTGSAPVMAGPGGCLGLCRGTPYVAAVMRAHTNNLLGFQSVGLPGGNVAAKPAGFSLGTAKVVTGSITLTHDPAGRQLRVAYDLMVDGVPRSFTDVLAIDLRAALGARMTAAVTAGTGVQMAAQTVSGWTTAFGVTRVPQSAELATVGQGKLPAAGVVQVTDAATSGVGAVWSRLTLNPAEGFSSSFDFSLQGTGTTRTQADGFGFLLQATGPTARGTPGGCIGACGIPNHVGMAVKTHVYNLAGLLASDRATPALGIDIGTKRNITGHATLTWDPATNLLSVHGNLVADGSAVSFADSMSVDLRTRFGNAMYVGFTGASGATRSTQTFQNWSMTTSAAGAPR